MPVIAKKTTNDIPLVPPNSYQAVCFAVWDIGIQKQEWQGQTKDVHKVVIAWELNEKINVPGNEFDGKRFVITNRYTLSLGNKAILRSHLVAWRGKDFTQEELQGFDLEKLIGANCLISIVHNEGRGRIFANISSIMALPNGTPKMSPENGTEPPKWICELMDKSNPQDPFEGPKDGIKAAHPMVEPPKDNVPPPTEDDLPF